jgi:polyphenol oxidase
MNPIPVFEFHPTLGQVLRPNWPAPTPVQALMSTRAGGVSLAPWSQLNLGDHVGDAVDSVQTNRQRWAQALGAQPVFMRQVHGTRVHELVEANADKAQNFLLLNSIGVQQSNEADEVTDMSTHKAIVIEADACLTAQTQQACTIMVADCLPVLFTSFDGQVVGAAHAGWRGLCDAVLERTLEAMRAQRQSLGLADSGLMAWLGPCIGPSAFEVGQEVRQAFMQAHSPDAAYFVAQAATSKFLADLPGLARARLQRAGLRKEDIYGNDGGALWCTVSQPEHYFSHRRDRVSGRMAACIWRQA